MQKSYTETTYVICHNGKDVIHPVKVEPGTNLSSGQPEVEEFTDEAAWTARLTELGYDTAKLAPPELRGPGAAKGGRPGLLSAEERKALKPEERKALRAERQAARAAKAPVAPAEEPKA